MGLSARTDDLTGQPLGEGFISVATSGGNQLTFQSPAQLNEYRAGNRGQLAPGTPHDSGNHNTTDQTPSTS